MSETATDRDRQLLARYTCDRAEDAFTEIVRRHLDLVHSAALRQVRSPQLAEEVAQSAFTDLARNAHRLAPDTVLTAWLYQVTRRTAIDVVRREARRRLREQIATEMNALNETAHFAKCAEAEHWAPIEPLLDEAMAALDDTDRAAVLLRYFENQSLREVGATLGTSDDAAQKRVSRAVERLREFFAKRGVTVGTSGLVVVISANAVQAAPVGLAVTISTAAALAGTTLATTAIKTIAMTTLQKAIIGAALAAAVGTGFYEARQATQLREQNQTLQQQQAPLTEQLRQLQRERDDATNRFAALFEENTALKGNPAELLRLRGKVAQLQAELNAFALPKPATGTVANDTTDADTKGVLGKIAYLKRRLKEMPEQNIPEIEFLNDDDWLRVVQFSAMAVNLESDDGIRRALSHVRQTAKQKFAQRLGNAVKSFAKDNLGQLPTEVLLLKSYLDSQTAPVDASTMRYGGTTERDRNPFQRSTYPPSDSATLQRYHMIAAGNLDELRLDQPIIAEKPPMVDARFDRLLQIGLNSYTGYAANGTNVSRGTWGGGARSQETVEMQKLDSLISLPADHQKPSLRSMLPQVTEEQLEVYRQKKLNELNQRVDEAIKLLKSSTNK